MPVDYSKFKDIQDSDEEPIWDSHDGKKIKGLPQKKLEELEASAQSLKNQTCFCYLDFAVDMSALRRYEGELSAEGVHLPAGGRLGRVVVQLDQALHAPRLCENFRLLCTGERGLGVGNNKLHYRGRRIDTILPKFCIQVSIPNEYSCWGRYLEDENLRIPGVSFDRPGLVAAGNHGPGTNSCTFMIMLNEANHLDGHNQILGRVVRGMEVLRFIEKLPTSNKERSYLEPNVKTWWGGKPMVDITVQQCGELKEDEVDLSPAADGDDFPEDAMDCSHTKDHDKLYFSAEKIREIGNKYFRTKEYAKALEKYKKAQRYLEPLLHIQHVESFGDEEPRTWMAGGVRPKDRTDIVRANLTIQLNVCQTLLALQEWRAAIAIADSVLLELVGKHSMKTCGAFPNEPLTMKALFRRARARVGLSDVEGEVSQLEEAIEDLKQALLVQPGNREVQQELERVRVRQQEADSKGKHVYQNMLRPETDN